MRAANQRPIVAMGILFTILATAGCSTTSQRPSTTVQLVDGRATGLGAAANEREALNAAVAAHAALPDLSTPPAVTAAVPDLDVSHPQVQNLMEQYQTSMRTSLERALQRGSKYVPSMKTTLREEGVPPDFAYGVPIVESGYSLSATSHAGAVGPWQFILGTGRRYGLRIDGYVDERRDPEKATRAAARYLRDLYDRFGDWHLALAAYNTGEANIERIKYGRGCESFWEMRERGYLPSETSEYVPRVIAAMEVAKSAKHYGIEIPKIVPAVFDTIEVNRTISLQAVAQLSGSDVDTIKELNPALKRGMVPPDGYTVRLPQGTRDQFQVALAAYREPVRRPAAHSGQMHTVRRGDTLSAIARAYGISVQALARANGLRASRGLKAGQRLRIPGRPARARSVASVARSKPLEVASAKRSRASAVSRTQRARMAAAANRKAVLAATRNKRRASADRVARSTSGSAARSRTTARASTVATAR
ncbi:MAG: transglycosylase SLT domain-containing protein [Candidatus Binatia bacterium]